MKKKLIASLVTFSLVISVAAAPFLTKQVAAVDTTGSESQNEESGEQYDTEKPVIESITVDKQGETVASGESVKVSVSAYDAGVGIKSFYYSLYGESFGAATYDLTFNEETKLYESTIEIDESMDKGKYYIGQIVAVDYNGNYSRGVVSVNEDTNTNADDALYWFQVNNEIISEDEPTFTIDSVSLMKDGVEVTTEDALNVNDTVHMSVKLSGDVDLVDNIRVDFVTYPTDDGNHNNTWKQVHLDYQEDSQSWEGDFSITEDYYPGEYYLYSLNVALEMRYFSFYYYENDILEAIRFSVIDNGYDKEAPVVYSLSLEKNHEVVRAGDCVTFEAVITDNVKVNNVWIYLNAAADIYYGSSRTIYLSQVGETDVYRGIIEITEDMYPCEWYVSSLNVSDTSGNYVSLSTEPDTDVSLEEAYYINVVNGSSFVNPTYNLVLEYIAENGDILTKEVENVARRTTAQELADNYFVPQHSALKFVGWDVPCGVCSDNYIRAKYSNVMVRLYVSYIGVIETKVVEKGEVINLPKETEGRSISWFLADTNTGTIVNIENDTVKIDDDADYSVLYVQGLPSVTPQETQKPEETKSPDETQKPDETKVPDETQKPDETKAPDETKKPEETKAPQETQKPEETKAPIETQIPEETDAPVSMTNVLSEQQIRDVINEINKKETGGNVEVTMQGATVVPKDILETIKGKDVNVVLEMDGYTWTINGKSVLSENLTDINLEVIRNTNYIPSNIVSTLAGGNHVEQISLTHQGNFGFTASLTLPVDNKYAGQYGNLYYYDSDGVMKFIDAGLIGADGKVSLKFSHASDYALVISANAEKLENSAKTEQKTEAQLENNKVNTAKSPTTGDTAPIERTLLFMGLALMVIAIMFMLAAGKRNRTE